MNDERLAELQEKYKDRNLLEELAWGAYADHSGYISKQNGEFLNWLCMKAYKALKERPKGEWTYGEDEQGQDGWFCSECDFFVPWYYEFYKNDINFIRDYKACPHCLAEMITYTGKDHKPIEQKGDEV
jgi:hypothetical protein